MCRGGDRIFLDRIGTVRGGRCGARKFLQELPEQEQAPRNVLEKDHLFDDNRSRWIREHNRGFGCCRKFSTNKLASLEEDLPPPTKLPPR